MEASGHLPRSQPERVISVIVASRDRPEQLSQFLTALNGNAFRDHGAELVLVDSASEPATRELMSRFRQEADFPVIYVRSDVPGQGAAQNLGVIAARGEVLAFTDDDCELAPDYLAALMQHFVRSEFDYGFGAILRGSRDLDPQVANTEWWGHKNTLPIPPHAFLAPNVVQGANMFFRRKVFDRIGGFRRDLGPGARFPHSDLNFGHRAASAGFKGCALPQVRVTHHHGRLKGSPEAKATVFAYARSRGAHVASLLAEGDVRAWSLWQEATPNRALSRPELLMLREELSGARGWIDYLLRERPDETAMQQLALEEVEPSLSRVT